MPPEPPAPGNESKPPIGGGGGGGGGGPGTQKSTPYPGFKLEFKKTHLKSKKRVFELEVKVALGFH